MSKYEINIPPTMLDPDGSNYVGEFGKSTGATGGGIPHVVVKYYHEYDDEENELGFVVEVVGMTYQELKHVIKNRLPFDAVAIEYIGVNGMPYFSNTVYSICEIDYEDEKYIQFELSGSYEIYVKLFEDGHVEYEESNG